MLRCMPTASISSNITKTVTDGEKDIQMTEYVAKRNQNRCPTHPGALLRDDILPAIKLPKAVIAERLGISRQHLYDILNENKPVSPTVAVRLGKLFGVGTGVWLRMQAAYDGWQAERQTDASGIETIKAA